MQAVRADMQSGASKQAAHKAQIPQITDPQEVCTVLLLRAQTVEKRIEAMHNDTIRAKAQCGTIYIRVAQTQ